MMNKSLWTAMKHSKLVLLVLLVLELVGLVLGMAGLGWLLELGRRLELELALLRWLLVGLVGLLGLGLMRLGRLRWLRWLRWLGLGLMLLVGLLGLVGLSLGLDVVLPTWLGLGLVGLGWLGLGLRECWVELELRSASTQVRQQQKNNSPATQHNPIITFLSHFLSERARLEWLGDVQELQTHLRAQQYSSWRVNLWTAGVALQLVIAQIRCKLYDAVVARYRRE